MEIKCLTASANQIVKKSVTGNCTLNRKIFRVRKKIWVISHGAEKTLGRCLGNDFQSENDRIKLVEEDSEKNP
uniref:Uncharacterized protein n=1 Tax=Romanomermis culicivorax TaxID=13658 RepID=A0A915K399_ROMCU